MIENELREYLKKITKLEVSPIFSLGPYPSIAYKITPISGGVVKQSQLEVRLIGENYDNLLLMKEKLVSILDMNEQTTSISLNKMVFRSVLAGGGDLYNDQIQMWEVPTIFIITWRCK